MKIQHVYKQLEINGKKYNADELTDKVYKYITNKIEKKVKSTKKYLCNMKIQSAYKE